MKKLFYAKQRCKANIISPTFPYLPVLARELIALSEVELLSQQREKREKKDVKTIFKQLSKQNSLTATNAILQQEISWRDKSNAECL